MYEVILVVCAFANNYSVDLVCEEKKMDQLQSCAHIELNLPDGYFIKKVSCSKMVPVAPKEKPGIKSA